MPSPFALVTLRAAAMALVLARRTPGRGERTARFARVVRYCRARGLRGPASSWKVHTLCDVIENRFREADRS